VKTLALTFLCCVAAVGQSGPASTLGECSPANTGNNNTFTINCGIGKPQGDQMVSILNKILARQLDPDAVMAILGAMKTSIDKIEKQTADRFFTAQQKTDLAKILRRAPQPIVIGYLAERESRAYGESLVLIFGSAKWEVTPVLMASLAAPVYGIEVYSRDDLLKVFSQARVEAHDGYKMPIPGTSSGIFVGLKR
jgi:hypothetical protein